MKRIRLYIVALMCLGAFLAAKADSIPSAFSKPLLWRIGVEAAGGYVPGTNGFLRGDNASGKRIDGSFGGALRADFSFGGDTREGMLYRGLYQGVGIGANAFFSGSELGAPISAFVYQGAPICRFSRRLWLGYEWKFGAAFGWKRYDEDAEYVNPCVSTRVTAMMGIAFKLHYALAESWVLSAGIEGAHYSNGNTSWPNSGVNAVGVTLGVAYAFGSSRDEAADAPSWLAEEADRGEWMYDIVAFGAWRKRIVEVGDPAERELSPGKFAVAGLQFAPLRRINRWVAVGPALDLQWGESAGIAPYWVEGSTGGNMKFMRPPFGKQLSAGLSAHAELTMPIFAVNVGLGYDIISPKGNRRFYQSLTLKTFVTKRIFVNVGYRLADFKDPENLMLGIGVRL